MAEPSQPAQGQQPPPQPQQVPPPSQQSAPPPESPRSPRAPPTPSTTGEALRGKFRDFDDPAVYNDVKEHGQRNDAKNFVVNFGGAAAEIALDLELEDFQALLRRRKDNQKGNVTLTPIRWM